MEVIDSKNIKEPVILLKILNNNSLVVVDSQTTVRFFNPNEITLINGYKVKVRHKRYRQSMVAFSNDTKYFVSVSPDCKEARLYDANTKEIITEVQKHHGEVSCVGIDPLSRYMFSCGDDGKIYAFELKSGKLVFTLPFHIDTINDIAFSQNSNWVATASFDKKISLYNLATMTPKFKLIGHKSPVMKVKFLQNNRLLSIGKDSMAIVWNVYSGKVIHRFDTIHDVVTQLTTSDNDEFLFIGTELGYVILYDLNTYELLSKKYIKLHSMITALEFNKNNNHLIIGTEEGTILSYNIYEGEEKFQDLLKVKDFESIQEESDKNPILKYTKVCNLVVNLWETTLEKAKIALEKGDEKKATGLFKHFKNIPAKHTMIRKVMLEYEEFGKFSMFAKQGKLTLAYGLANTHPMYKDSSIYRALETNWKKVFELAQGYALDPKGEEKAKEILAPYRGISEKTLLIKDLLTQGEVYKRFRVSIGQKDFRVAFELIKLNPFLREFKDYENLMKYADTLYIKSQKLIEEGDTHSAIKLLRVLEEFTDFTQEVRELILAIESRQKFFNAIEEEDIVAAYSLLDRFHVLQETEDGKTLQLQWNGALNEANAHAVDGDIIGVKKSLSPYIKINSKYTSFATVFGLCYMVQLEDAMNAKMPQSALESGIKKYMLSFGLQDQIENFYKQFKLYYPNSKLTLDHLTQGSITMWRPSMIEDSILD